MVNEKDSNDFQEATRHARTRGDSATGQQGAKVSPAGNDTGSAELSVDREEITSVEPGWDDLPLYTRADTGPGQPPPWSRDRASRSKSGNRLSARPPVAIRLTLIGANVAALACVVYAAFDVWPVAAAQASSQVVRVSLIGGLGVVVLFAATGLLIHAFTAVWRWFRRRQAWSAPPSQGPSAGTVLIVWAGVASILLLSGASELQGGGSARRDSATAPPTSSPAPSESSGPTTEPSPTAMIWTGTIKDSKRREVGTVVLTVSPQSVTSLEVDLDVKKCPSALRLSEEVSIQEGEMTFVMRPKDNGSQIRGTVDGERLVGRLVIRSCSFEGRVTASPRPLR